MNKSRQMFTDRDYLDAQFSNVLDRLDAIAETAQTHDNRIRRLEQDISGAKLLGKTALGVSACLGAIISWTVDLLPKFVALLHK